MPLRNVGRRNAIAKQQQAILRWLVKFGGRRQSEAAMEVTTYSTARRRAFFNNLRACGCIEFHGDQWVAVKDVDTAKHLTPETIAAYVDGGLTSEEFAVANDHLAKCRECTALLANTVKTTNALKAAEINGELLAACALFTAAAHEVRDLLNAKGLACPASIAFAAEKARHAIERAKAQ